MYGAQLRRCNDIFKFYKFDRNIIAKNVHILEYESLGFFLDASIPEVPLFVQGCTNPNF